MSAVAVTWALGQIAGGSGPKAVLVALAHHADAKGECFPSQTLLAKELEMGVRTVREHLQTIEHEARLIERARRFRRNGSRTSDGYRLRITTDKQRPETTTPPAESAASLPANLAAGLPADFAGRTDEYDTLPAESAGGRADEAETGGDHRQILPSPPADLAGPTTFEQSVEEQITASTAAAVVVSPPHTCAPAHEAAGDDGGRAVAIELMRAAHDEYVASLSDRLLIGRFKGQARAIVNGGDYTAWKDTEGNDVPWPERPRIFDCALGILEAKERDNLRRSLQLAIQRQFDPLKLKRAVDVMPGSEAAEIMKRGKSSLDEDRPSTERRVGHLTMANGYDPQRERVFAENAELADWERDNAVEAAAIRARLEKSFAADPEWANKPEIEVRIVMTGEYRREIRERLNRQQEPAEKC